LGAGLGARDQTGAVQDSKRYAEPHKEKTVPEVVLGLTGTIKLERRLTRLDSACPAQTICAAGTGPGEALRWSAMQSAYRRKRGIRVGETIELHQDAPELRHRVADL